MSEMPVCPECASEFTYGMGDLLVCSLCACEWFATADATDGDTVTLVKTLKVKGIPSEVGYPFECRGAGQPRPLGAWLLGSTTASPSGRVTAPRWRPHSE